jgi:NADH:ubiquinone reductase (H+-translocating)
MTDRHRVGLPAYVMWAFVHNLYLIGWGNRVGTLYTWVRGMAFARNRGHRLITFAGVNQPVTPADELTSEEDES